MQTWNDRTQRQLGKMSKTISGIQGKLVQIVFAGRVLVDVPQCTTEGETVSQAFETIQAMRGYGECTLSF